MQTTRVKRYVGWIDRHKYVVIALSVVTSILCGYVASGLPIRSEFSNLLPPDRQSVRDLNQLKERIRSFGTVFLVVDGHSAENAARVADAIRPKLAALDSDLVSRVLDSDTESRAYFWKNRFLFVSLADLREAVDTLREKIHDAKLAANPLFVSLDDDIDDEKSSAATKSEDLVARLDKAESDYRGKGSYVSPDGRVHLFVLRTTTPSTDFGRGRRLLSALDEIARNAEKIAPGVSVGLTGNVVSAYLEDQSIMRGIVVAALITASLIALLLLVYFRAPLAVAASLWSLAVALTATFALTYFLIGYLNVMSAFLIAIVAGNGINSGLMLLARYFEELRKGDSDEDALAAAIGGALRGTLSAAIAAGLAYGALAVTEFRGFRHFGIIGSIGMILSWLSAFSVLPAGLCILRSWGRIPIPKAPLLDRAMAHASPRRPGIFVGFGVAFLVASIALTVSFALSEPFEKDWRNLRSKSAAVEETKVLDQRMRNSVGTKFGAGLTSRFVVAVDDASAVSGIKAILQAAPKSLLKSSLSLNDLLPDFQEEKLRLLAELRDLADEAAASAIDDEDKETALRVRPPDELRPITFSDIPMELSWPFVEKDGSIGKLILVAGADHFTSWSVDDRVALATGVRELDLPAGTLVGGQSFVIADIIDSMVTDGPKASVVALLGALFAILVLVGVGRHAMVTLLAGLSGVVGMVALCHLFGLKVNFLDLVALPITIGIGIDYSVNLAARDMQEGEQGEATLLGTTGGAVMLCSLTTIIGYGSLLLSENAGIRSFGLAAMLGEFACLTGAILIVPGFLMWLRQRDATSS